MARLSQRLPVIKPLERAHGETERERVQRRTNCLIKREFDSGVADVELGLSDVVFRLFLVEGFLVGGGGGGEGGGRGP
jgi:hypothetical protein